MNDQERPLFTARIVRDLMTPQPLALHPDATLGDAMALMESRRIRHVPVVDEDNVVIGLVSQRDILRSAWPTSDAGTFTRLSTSALLSDILTRPVDTIEPDAPVTRAARYMLGRKRDCLPVVSPGGHLVGILTAADFLREVVRNSPADAPDQPAE